ncbi:MAG: polyhydroxyalkanoate synthesis repressor PhaR [Thiothrix nivea]|nr:MAG: polyhydroxyalkanoate synthesis repressor PhaR [Thiothrix nivea]
MSETRIIKKYPNRRLYDTHQSRYITLSSVRELVMEEIPFQVIDRQSGEDITRSILLQIIMEQETGGEPLFSADILSQFIRNYGVTTQQGFTSFLEQSMNMFSTQQEAMREQMQKALTSTPLDNWLKMSEKNMQTWQKMQKDMFKGILPDSDKDKQ